MRKICILGVTAAVLALAWAGLAAAAEPVSRFVDKVLPFENLETAGYFKNETALSLAGFDEFYKILNIVDFKANYKFNDRVELFGEIKLFYDAVYDVEGSYRDLVNKEKNTKLQLPVKTEWIRQAFLDVYMDRVDLRLGKQQVVWGTTDGVRILDLVNPLDYREWTLNEYPEMRIPLWMANVETELNPNSHIQLLLIPDYQANYYPPAGSPYAPRTVVIGAESANQPFVTVTTIDEKPSRNLENTKIGLRWRNVVEGGYLSGLEYTLNYLHTYDFASSAYTRTTVNINPFGPPDIQVKLTRRAEQIEVIGGSFSKSITEGIIGDLGKGWTVRGEYAYIANGAMNYGTDKNIVGTVDVDQFNYAIGLDKVFLTDLQFSLQFIQLIAHATEDFDKSQYTLLFGPTRGPLDKVENLITLKLSKDFMHERLKPEVLIIYTDDNDWRISPAVSFELNDNWMVASGLHIFEGDSAHLHGEFDKVDQVFFETTYSW